MLIHFWLVFNLAISIVYNESKIRLLESSLVQQLNLLLFLHLGFQLSSVLTIYWLQLSTVYSTMPALSISHQCFNPTLNHENFDMLHLIFSPSLELHCFMEFSLCRPISRKFSPTYLWYKDSYSASSPIRKLHELWSNAFSITGPSSICFWVNFVDTSFKLYSIVLMIAYRTLRLLKDYKHMSISISLDCGWFEQWLVYSKL